MSKSSLQHEEIQYLDMVKKIIAEGNVEQGRNGTTYSKFGESMRFSLSNGVVPILTTKKVAWKTCLKELLWFISGNTNNKTLNQKGVHIWDQNSSRNFLDDRGLYDRPVDDLGPIYGHQWRFFNAPYIDCSTDYMGQGVDQLQTMIDSLKDPTKRNSRRLVMSSWNPCQIHEMALPPCHVLCQFHVHNGNKLSCALYQRSADLCLGVPFNIASYSFLTHLLAKHCGLEAHEFIYFMGNVHVYESHIEPIQSQLKNIPFDFPRLSIVQVRENINDYTINDFVLSDYKSYEPINMDMIA
uniref:thymidylate synthase n=1 Tax=viral metagenome TaxID=1070528 RepID=A0A6C0B102_9ZZZZ